MKYNLRISEISYWEVEAPDEAAAAEIAMSEIRDGACGNATCYQMSMQAEGSDRHGTLSDFEVALLSTGDVADMRARFVVNEKVVREERGSFGAFETLGDVITTGTALGICQCGRETH